jgi:F0F1-type ATP synthase assembly protein I
VFAIPVAAGLGWLADRHFGSAPIGLLIGIGIGFAAFVLRLVRLGREMQAGAANQETPAPAPDSSRDEREAARIGGGDEDDDHDDHDDDWGEDHRTH